MSLPGRVYVDFDDVLCETARMLLWIAGREYGCRLAFAQIVSFDIGVSFGLTPDQVGRVLELAHRDDTLLAMEPVAGARDVLAGWRRAGCRVDIVTGRPPSTREASAAWLEREGVPHDALVFVDKYARGHPPHPGVPCLSLPELGACGYGLAIDDSPPTLRYLAGTLGVPSILFHRPWNADAPTAGTRAPVTRCHDWAEIRRQFGVR